VDVQDLYLRSLGAIGIHLKEHDIRFEEDNWESPTLGAWGMGWQVLLDGLEITQFTYFQQSGGIDLDPISVELTYGLERICAFLQGVESVTICAGPRTKPTATFASWKSSSSPSTALIAAMPPPFARIRTPRKQAKELLDGFKAAEGKDRVHWPLLAAYDHCLKCSHLFNLMERARALFPRRERAALMARGPHHCLPHRRRLYRTAQRRNPAERGALMKPAAKDKRVELLFEVAAKKFLPACF